MGLTLVWAEPAAEQFAERLDYIGALNPDAARQLRRKVDVSLRRLSEFPGIGRWVPEFGSGFYREIMARPLRILYEDPMDKLVVTFVYRQEEAIGPDSYDLETDS